MPRSDQNRSRKVLLIGWDAADWQVIDPLLERGQMPNLAALLRRGVRGNLATIHPVLSPMLWTTIATGKRAYDHGILGFVEPKPDRSGIRPVSSTSRRCKAIWNILTQNNLQSVVLNWFASHPAEPIQGVVVADTYSLGVEANRRDRRPIPSGAIHPESLVGMLDDLRVATDEITASDIAPFIPLIHSIDQSSDPRPLQLANMLARCATVHAAATHLLRHETWDFAAVYYNMIDHVNHTFMPFHPPRLPWVSEEDYERYKHVVTAAYQFHDMMLGVLLTLGGSEAAVLLISDHGFESGQLRRGLDAWDAPEDWHRHHGIAALAGPGVQQGKSLYGATLLDVAPTLLALFGLAVGKDMEGRVWGEVLDDDMEWDLISSWEHLEGDDGRHAESAREDPFESAEAIRQLVDLGYLADPGDDAEQAISIAALENRILLARSLTSGYRPGRALPIWEELAAEHPEDVRYAIQLARCCLSAGQKARARNLLDQHAARAGKAGFALTMAELELLCGQPAKALAHLDALSDDESRAIGQDAIARRYCYGQVYQQLGRYDDAIGQYQRVLQWNPDHARAYQGLADCYLQKQEYEQAVDCALKAIGLKYWQPLAHLFLGRSLIRLGRHDEAIEALKLALKMAPQLKEVHFWLADAYEYGKNDPLQAAQHRAQYAAAP